VVRGRILAGNYFLLKKHYNEYFLKALKIRRLIQQDFISCWDRQIDMLVTPVTLTDAPSYEDYMLEDNRTHTAKQDYCTQPVNLAGLPAVTVPVRLSARSLPLAVQLIGPHGSDLRLLRAAARLEQSLNFPRLVLAD
jgi:aspartyl-tRNA(Asn)/glutamyl-tRNA(Gln) amidotransferase subunit A